MDRGACERSHWHLPSHYPRPRRHLDRSLPPHRAPAPAAAGRSPRPFVRLTASGRASPGSTHPRGCSARRHAQVRPRAMGHCAPGWRPMGTASLAQHARLQKTLRGWPRIATSASSLRAAATPSPATSSRARSPAALLSPSWVHVASSSSPPSSTRPMDPEKSVCLPLDVQAASSESSPSLSTVAPHGTARDSRAARSALEDGRTSCMQIRARSTRSHAGSRAAAASLHNIPSTLTCAVRDPSRVRRNQCANHVLTKPTEKTQLSHAKARYRGSRPPARPQGCRSISVLVRASNREGTARHIYAANSRLNKAKRTL